MNTGDKIKRLRLDRKLSQTQLGGMVGVSKAAVSKWERGHADMNVIHAIRLADIFGVRLRWLFANTSSVRQQPFNEELRKVAAFYDSLNPDQRRRVWDYMQWVASPDRPDSAPITNFPSSNTEG